MEISDDELMRRVMRDDRGALGRLFDRHQPTVYAFLCRFTGDALMAEDATQEAFWRVWQYRSSYAERCPFRAWLFRIARNAAIDELRRRGRRDGDAGDEAIGAARQIFPGSETDVSRRALQDQVRAALRCLPEEQRLCLVLREYHEMSHREIADVLGCTEGHARVIGHRARQALRARLTPMLESEERCVG